MKATRKNISDVLGTHAKGIVFNKTKLENGYAMKGFMPRDALTDLMNYFHVYINKKQEVVVLTTGRLNVTSRV